MGSVGFLWGVVGWLLSHSTPDGGHQLANGNVIGAARSDAPLPPCVRSCAVCVPVLCVCLSVPDLRRESPDM